ncbi:MAG TPA: nodulation protein NfeD [Lacunisphaera sp.]
MKTKTKAVLTAWGLSLAALGAAERVALARVDGPIGPATAGYLTRAVDRAAEDGAQCLVVQLDTPGGLLDSTKVIVQKLLVSPVPTVVYVAPAGATAASAGCFITLAADIAAMAPTTSIGAAHPVAFGGNPAGGEGKPDETMKRKLESYAVSYMESIASRRQRNVEWAVSSVRDSASVTAERALELKVIDLVAGDLTALLVALDGRKVGDCVLRTKDAGIVEISMTTRERVFQLIWRPEVMFILMLVALYGIIGELSNPGAILPGVVGLIALILALYMAAILPVNLAGVLLLVLAVILFTTDVFAPTHGVLTAGGIAAFFLGALMLFDRTDPTFRLSLALIVPATVATALFFIMIVSAGLRAQLLPVRAGRETMPGQVVPARARIDAAGGWVLIEGEHWNAVSETVVEKDQLVEIIGIEGLTLKVKPFAR